MSIIKSELQKDIQQLRTLVEEHEKALAELRKKLVPQPEITPTNSPDFHAHENQENNDESPEDGFILVCD